MTTIEYRRAHHTDKPFDPNNPKTRKRALAAWKRICDERAEELRQRVMAKERREAK